MANNHPHVTVRPFTPRKYPYTFTSADVETLLRHAWDKTHAPYYYCGWKRRKKQDGSTGVGFFMSSGNTKKEARISFTTSSLFGENIWELFFQNSTV